MRNISNVEINKIAYLFANVTLENLLNWSYWLTDWMTNLKNDDNDNSFYGNCNHKKCNGSFLQEILFSACEKKGEPNRVEDKCVSDAKRQMLGEHVPHVQRHETWSKRNETSRPC